MSFGAQERRLASPVLFTEFILDLALFRSNVSFGTLTLCFWFNILTLCFWFNILILKVYPIQKSCTRGTRKRLGSDLIISHQRVEKSTAHRAPDSPTRQSTMHGPATHNQKGQQ